MPSARRMAAQFPRWRIWARRVLQVRLRFAARSWRAPQQPEIRCTESSLSYRPSMVTVMSVPQRRDPFPMPNAFRSGLRR